MFVKLLTTTLLILISFQASAGSWHLAYENSSTGQPLSGSYLELIEQFKEGASVKVFVNDHQMMVTPSYCKIDQNNQYFLCQARFHGANDKSIIQNVTEVDIFTTNGERIYQAYTTTGVFKYEVSENVSIKWFTQE